MLWRPALPTLLSLAGTGLLFAAVYKLLPAPLGIAGFALLLVGGIAALRRTRIDRRQLGSLRSPGPYS